MIRRSFRNGDVDLSYLDSGGDGAVVVLLHGLAGSSAEFVPTAQQLFPDFRSILLDQRGHGRSTRTPSDTSRRAYVSDVVALIDHLACAAPIRLVGQSMGAHTAMLTASTRPDLIERLVMLEGWAGSGAAEETAALRTFFGSWPVPFADPSAAVGYLGNGPLAQAWIADMESGPDGLWPAFEPEVMASTIEAVHQPRWREWENLEVPTLAVFAGNGMFTDRQKDEMMARRPATLRADLPGASHDAHLDSLAAWTAILEEFLWRDGHR